MEWRWLQWRDKKAQIEVKKSGVEELVVKRNSNNGSDFNIISKEGVC